MHANMKPRGMAYALGLVSQPFMPRNKNIWHLATVWVHSLSVYVANNSKGIFI